MFKDCLQCNKKFEFKYKQRNRTYCSKECASILRRIPKIIKICLECNKNYEVLPCRELKTKFCSKICAISGKVKIRKYTPKGFQELITKKCERCFKDFEYNIAKQNIAKFCSINCLKRPKEKSICIKCKKEYEYIPRNRHNSIKFCSRKCTTQSLSERAFWKTATQIEINNYLKNIFETKVKKLENGCWEWLGGRYKAGYGGMTYKGKSAKVHRISYMFHNNDWDISPNILICHRCDQVWCCAPRHLFKGSSKDNVHDMIFKNRHNWPSGENASGAKMSEQTAIKVIEMLKNKIKMTKIALDLNIGKAAVNAIKRNKSWKHLAR